MAKEFLAKSNPKETIQEHTDALLENYECLKRLYPNIPIKWKLLELACLAHDLGKMNSFFQARLRWGKRSSKEIHHGILSLAFVNFEKLIKIEAEGKPAYEEDELRALAQAIAYHHDRKLDYEEEDLEQEVEKLGEEFEEFDYLRLEKVLIQIPQLIDESFYSQNERLYPEADPLGFSTYVLLKGLLNRIDYAASAHIVVETENDFLLDCLEQNLMAKFRQDHPEAEWNQLQCFMADNRDQNVIVVAETGMGKTEAGLLWIGNHKGFFTLPLKTAINAVYYRLRDQVIGNQQETDYQDKLGLLHSDVRQRYYEAIQNKNPETEQELNADEYYQRTKQLSLPLTICTIDQLFDFVFLYPGFELKLATLSYAKVVIDEVQMYAPELLAYLILGIQWITRYGGQFAVMTATLPPIFKQLLEQRKVEFIAPPPFYLARPVRHKMRVYAETINPRFIIDQFADNKILVVCNTVKQAQEIYGAVVADLSGKKAATDTEPVVELLHSGFIGKDRKAKETAILEFGRLADQRAGIWIATQVVEASLDIDFDVLVTELSDLNGLFQRLGRCNRQAKRPVVDYNSHVFVGDLAKRPTGIGTVIDSDIFEFSRQKIVNVDGFIDEPTKVEWVNQVYCLENLKGTEYVTRLNRALHYIETIEPYHMEKRQVVQEFRNIISKKVVPRPVYEANQEIIRSYLEILSQPYDSNEKQRQRRQKLEARIRLEDYMVSIPAYYYQKNQELLKELPINQYESLFLFDCHYSAELGIKPLAKEEQKTTNQNQEDFFM